MLGIIFPHHANDAVTAQNMGSFRRHNPGAFIIPLTGHPHGAGLPGAISFASLPEFGSRWADLTKNGMDMRAAWMCSDLAIYGAYLSNHPKCDRWMLAEWDMFCTTSIERAFSKYWNCDLASCWVRTYPSGWMWFKSAKPPDALLPFRSGTTPLGAVIVSDDALSKIVAKALEFKDKLWWGGETNSEFRFGTFAKACGISATEMPEMRKTISWGEINFSPLTDPPGIFHPVKRLLIQNRNGVNGVKCSPHGKPR